MSQDKNYNQVSELAAVHLGKIGGEGYKDQYDPSLLVKIPRKLNREAYGIDEKKLPFVGVDVWNAYEVSALTNNGLPVSGMLKIICPANSKYHVESKSIKLYLNSFNMTKLGYNTREVIREIENKVSRDLSLLLEANIQVAMFPSTEESGEASLADFTEISQLVDLELVKFDTYHSDESTLQSFGKNNVTQYYKLRSDLLRSNCRVTNQPDWGDVFIEMRTNHEVDVESIAKYIVSHRKVNHFHEEVTEMMFMHLQKVYEPEDLMVACLYTRRGGLDINPVRATSERLIPHVFKTTDIRLAKTLRQ
jgi:7-cyano-7-deazaguanine reductase